MSFWRKVVSRGNKLYESEKRKALVLEKLKKQNAGPSQIIEGDFSETARADLREVDTTSDTGTDHRHVIGK